MPPERRLAAIMFTDIVGYTALIAVSLNAHPDEEVVSLCRC